MSRWADSDGWGLILKPGTVLFGPAAHAVSAVRDRLYPEADIEVPQTLRGFSTTRSVSEANFRGTTDIFHMIKQGEAEDEDESPCTAHEVKQSRVLRVGGDVLRHLVSLAGPQGGWAFRDAEPAGLEENARRLLCQGRTNLLSCLSLWRGLVRRQAVCVKIMRIFEESDVQAVLKEFGREALIWRQLCHPNVLPIFGLYYLETWLCLVSPWMENGHIMKFLRNKNSTNTDRLSLPWRYNTCTKKEWACIADFGVSTIANANSPIRRQLQEQGQHAIKHLNYCEEKLGTISAQMFTLSHIMAEKVPFYDLPNDMTVMFKVLEGKRPLRPMSWSGTRALDSVWGLVEDCWEGKVEMRPTASQIVERLIGPSIGAKTTSSTTDWDGEFTSKFRRSLQAEPLLLSVTQIERMLFGDEAVEACTDCFPDKRSSGARNEQGLSQITRAPKRPYEEEISDSNTQGNKSAQAKKSRP
ncbi:kinase-like domain-containing protein [Mycena leptocephala]|nr:kinase-like domain-containing protein [Mycena leptocephala]